jgi:hypothetical protein
MGKVDDSAAAAVDGADDAEVNAHALVNQQTRPAGPLTTSTVGPLDYANKPKISAEKPRLSVNAKPMRQTRINPANPRRPLKDGEDAYQGSRAARPVTTPPWGTPAARWTIRPPTQTRPRIPPRRLRPRPPGVC